MYIFTFVKYCQLYCIYVYIFNKGTSFLSQGPLDLVFELDLLVDGIIVTHLFISLKNG